MTKTESIIWRRIEEKAHRMAIQYNESPMDSELLCWDAHCYKYIDTAGKVNFIISQEEFDKIKFALALKRTAFEVIIANNNKPDPQTRAILNFALSEKYPDFKVLETLMAIAPMWDDRDKKNRD